MGRTWLILFLAAAAGTDEGSITNLLALILSGGTALAGVAAFIRARHDRAKIVAEAAHLGRDDLRAELETAWAALDRERKRARERERELEDDLDATRRRVRELEQERTALGARVDELERRLDELGDSGVGPGH